MKATDHTTRRWGAYGLVFTIGFAALACQVLLFRKFLSVFEGNELGVALFFGSWLLWVALGARLARLPVKAEGLLVRAFEWLPLAYLPAYILQSWLILHARELAGVRSYEIFPLAKMLGVLFVANAPVSLCTGFLFTVACGWLAGRASAPVARVYIAESIGSACGGIAVTLLLAAGLPAETLALATLGVVASGFAASRSSRGAWRTAWLPLALVAAAMLAGAGARSTHLCNLRRWERILPRQALRGSISTPQATYLYGEYGEQFTVMAWESIADVLPGTENASRILALHLAQAPSARRFLVAGPGSLALARRLLELPQTESVVWLDPDPDYPRLLADALPERFRVRDPRLQAPHTDIRAFLASDSQPLDLVILNLPPASTLALNRYFTREFFELVRHRLAPDGVAGIRVAGGDNAMGDELINTGATLYHTLRSVFRQVVLKPGEETWLLASDGGGVTPSPALLRDRFAAVPGAARLYPPNAIPALYPPDRSEFQLQAYAQAAERLPPARLLNTDRQPQSLLHALLFAARESGLGPVAARAIRRFALDGAGVVPVWIALLVALRVLYVRLAARPIPQQRDAGAVTAFDCAVLAASTGLVNMLLTIVLMFLYQSQYGSLFLHVGLISALFMAGLAAGGALAGRLASTLSAAQPRRIASLGLLAHAGLIVAIAFIPGRLSHFAFAALFVLSGLAGGLYIPLAARFLHRQGIAGPAAGAVLETFDHLGGAAGGLLTGIALLPLFGTRYALGLMAALLLANLPLLWLGASAPATAPGPDDRFARGARRGAYAAFGLVALLLSAALLLQRSGTGEEARALQAAARRLAGPLAVTERTCTPPGADSFIYFALTDRKGQTNSYVIDTQPLSPEFQGYAGPIRMAARVAPDGALLDMAVIHSRETPAYLDALAGFFQRLRGRPVFGAAPLAGVDAVSGATLTSAAVLRTLRAAGPRFAAQALGHASAPPSAPPGSSGEAARKAVQLATLVALALGAFRLRYRPSRRLRLLFLGAVVLAAGVWLNAQFSLANVLALLGARLPSSRAGLAFALTLALPLLVLLWGNFYCGYLCPLGALQELAGWLRPAARNTYPHSRAGRWGRTLKYGLLAAAVALFACSLDHNLATPDPLTTAFAPAKASSAKLWLLAILALTLFCGRFWCRVLCPAGAFLALLNSSPLLRRYRPRVNPLLCVYGVSDPRELDCLCCDRCRVTTPDERQALRAARERTAPRRDALLLGAAGVLAALLFVQIARAWQAQRYVRASAAAGLTSGAMRKVDLPRLRERIREGTLSDHEARHYVPVAGGGAGQEDGR